MSDMTYNVKKGCLMSPHDRPLVWLHGEVKSPPLSKKARITVGFFLRELQQGHLLSMPHSRPMPSIGPRCHELRITDTDGIWRIIYRLDGDAVIIVDVFQKKTNQTPKKIIELCKNRLKDYDHA
jgi:phage-related protein